ncbi:hypothetical protein ABZ656_16445 [Streptomyces sp. NPDC007095]|uniref:hypothetical protein n=1 Tax=Streptomyces sp. NPDC007095 TaxID=3154482 RepID=UPI0033FD30D1
MLHAQRSGSGARRIPPTPIRILTARVAGCAVGGGEADRFLTGSVSRRVINVIRFHLMSTSFLRNRRLLEGPRFGAAHQQGREACQEAALAHVEGDWQFRGRGVPDIGGVLGYEVAGGRAAAVMATAVSGATYRAFAMTSPVVSSVNDDCISSRRTAARTNSTKMTACLAQT